MEYVSEILELLAECDLFWPIRGPLELLVLQDLDPLSMRLRGKHVKQSILVTIPLVRGYS